MAGCNCHGSGETELGDSILESVKKDLGASEWDDAFDSSIIRHINTAMMVLSQLGVGPGGGYSISGKGDSWGDYINEGDDIEGVRTYISKKVKIMFDPASSSFVNESDKAICDELEWRLNVAVDPG